MAKKEEKLCKVQDGCCQAILSMCSDVIVLSKLPNISLKMSQNKIVLCDTSGNKSKPNLAIICAHVMSCNLSYALLWIKYELELVILLTVYYIAQMYMQYKFVIWDTRHLSAMDGKTLSV